MNSYEKVFQVFQPITRVTGFDAGVLAAWFSWIGLFKYSKWERLFFVLASLAKLHQYKGLGLCIDFHKMLLDVLLWPSDIFNMSVARKYHGILKQQNLITVWSWSEDFSPSIRNSDAPAVFFLFTSFKMERGLKLTVDSTIHQRTVQYSYTALTGVFNRNLVEREDLPAISYYTFIWNVIIKTWMYRKSRILTFNLRFWTFSEPFWLNLFLLIWK